MMIPRTPSILANVFMLRNYNFIGRVTQKSFLATTTRSFKHDINVAIVGSGPAGFYTAQKLLKNPALKVDIYEKLPVPFGLVRFGVAPDHADVKNVINSFTNIGNDNRVNFLGNVSIGQDITLDELLQEYHAIVLCYGSSQDRLLNIEGESSPNVVSARQLVGWYNGVPQDRDLKINLDCDTACIIGQGNVGLDCARILLRPPGLDKTDISSHAYHRIAQSKIRRIVIVGRRGPIQVAFTTKEFREILKFDHCSIRVEPRDDIMDHLNNTELLSGLSRQRRRLTELIREAANNAPSGPEQNKDRSSCELRFLRSPIRVIPSNSGDTVEKIIVTKNKFNSGKDFFDEQATVVEVKDEPPEEIDCGLLIRSIGYKAMLIDKALPYDHKRGVIVNDFGRIQGRNGLYCSGWLATGPKGVIAGTLESSILTSAILLADIEAGTLAGLRMPKSGHRAILKTLQSRSVEVVHFNEWLKIDRMEKRVGEMMGKPREKMLEVRDMLKVAKGDD